MASLIDHPESHLLAVLSIQRHHNALSLLRSLDLYPGIYMHKITLIGNLCNSYNSR
jgi:hypothetical protein